MTVAEKIAEWLETHGITHAFGIIGGGNHILWDAIAERGFTEIVCTHHEQAAVMAAAYYYRASGKLALALVTTGAGSTNAVTGVMAAFMDRVPVLIISGNEPSKHMYTGMRVWGVQGYDSSGLVSGVATKCAKRMMEWRPSALDDARFEALRAPQGPVWIDLPKDVQSARV